MRIGMNLLLWTNHVTEAHYPLFAQLREIGYDGVEIPISADGDPAHFAATGRALRDQGLVATASTYLDAQTNIASADPAIRQAGLDRLHWIIDRCHALEAELVCGPIHSCFGYFTGQPPTADEKKWSAELLHRAGDYARQAGVTLLPEAINRFECYLVNTMADLAELLAAVDHPNVQGMFDTHHANLEEKSQRSAILAIAPYLRHVHISENDRGTPGCGQVNWSEVFSTLKEIDYDGWLTVEGFALQHPVINVWRDFSPPKALYTEGYRFIRSSWRNH